MYVGILIKGSLQVTYGRAKIVTFLLENEVGDIQNVEKSNTSDSLAIEHSRRRLQVMACLMRKLTLPFPL
jgi:hypothetical protein